ncbi:MAG TPA: hypothetical protein VE088_05910 [Gaiellaceae bacterium]|jgi:hypothetical protein|nr:hypothetical protein [Gaiellaceae bacterium]
MRALRLGAGFPPAYAAAVLALAVTGVYLALIATQGDRPGSRVPFVAASIAAAGMAAGAAGRRMGRAGGLAGGWAAATLWIWAGLGAASIGILVVPAAVLATLALVRLRAPAAPVTAGIALAFGIAVAGLVWTG